MIGKIYLASNSPRRQALLRQLAIDFEIVVPHADETVLHNESPLQYVQRIAEHKGAMAWSRITELHLPSHPVLSADTTVALNNQIIGKPSDESAAKTILKKLSGQAHQVHTAVSLRYADLIDTVISTTIVYFKELDDEEIAQYIATGEPFDKAGAYGIQGKAAAFIPRLEGSYTGVVGLPLYETVQLLKQCDFLNQAEPTIARTDE